MLSNIFRFLKRIFFGNDSVVESKDNLEIEDMSECNEELQKLIKEFEFASGNLLSNAKKNDEIKVFYSISKDIISYIEKNIVDDNSSRIISEIVELGENNISKNNKLRTVKSNVNNHLRKIKNTLSRKENEDIGEAEQFKEKSGLSTLNSSTKEPGQVRSPSSDKNNADSASNELRILSNKITSLQENVITRADGLNTKCTDGFSQSSKKINDIQSRISENKKLIVDGNQSIRNELNKLNKSIPDNLLKKDDFSFELDSKFKEFDSLKELAEELESLPATNRHIKSELSNISVKLDNLSVSSASTKKSVKVPEDIQAVDDLAKYMRDGVDLFENMSRLYVSKISELESLDKINEQNTVDVIKAKKDGIKQGELSEKISLAKEIADKFPSEFNAIKSVFEDVIKEQYEIGSVINVTNDNKNMLMPYFSTELELMEYEVISPAILINNDIVFKAKVAKLTQSPVESANNDESDATIKED